MLKITSPVLRSGLIAGVVAILPLAEAAAQALWDPQTRVPPLAARECTIIGSGYSVRIVAGPDGPGNPTAPFPLAVTNPGNPVLGMVTDSNCPAGSGPCLRWDYKWSYTGFNPSMVLVSVDSEVKVFAASSPSGLLTSSSLIYPPNSTTPPVPAITFENSINFGNVGGELGMRFTPNPSNFSVSIITEQGAAVGAVTAGFKGGHRVGFCAIAGANKTAGDPLLTQSKVLTSTVGACTINWTVSPDGCVTGASATPAACTVTNKDLVVGVGVATTATCGTELTGAFGSTEVCRWNSLLRKTTCVTIP